MADSIGFALAAVALAGSPGPATLSLAAIGASFGARQGVGYLAGIVAGMLAVCAVTASGATGAVFALPGARPVLGGLAVAYFAWLAWRIATAPPLEAGARNARRPTFTGGVFLSLVNPKGYAAMAALFTGFPARPEHWAADLALKIGILAVVMTSVNLVWLSGGAALSGVFRHPRRARVLNVAFAVLLVVSVAAAWLL